MILRRSAFLLLPLLIAAYIMLFLTADRQMSYKSKNISPAFPTPVLKMIGHSYLSQFIAEALFIKTAVYYGGLDNMPDEGNLEVLGQHFIAMSQLHPRMLDIYYRSEGVLAHRGIAFTSMANGIMQQGRDARPNEVVIPFFEGFNYAHYLNEPAKAAKVLREASQIDGAPRWIGHLASLLAAEGGNIRSGLIWLKGMQASSNDESEKRRYEEEIKVFEQGLLVQMALEQYLQAVKRPPDTLDELVPGFIGQLPRLKQGYRLEYREPNLFLKRVRI
jgi:hypothetical protein